MKMTDPICALCLAARIGRKSVVCADCYQFARWLSGSLPTRAELRDLTNTRPPDKIRKSWEGLRTRKHQIRDARRAMGTLRGGLRHPAGVTVPAIPNAALPATPGFGPV